MHYLSTMAKCLLCGAGVWYVGLVSADCENSGCTNYREPPQKKEECGTWAWAQKLQSEGWRLEFRQPNTDWYLLTAQLESGRARPEYEFRIDQEWYSPTSIYVRGTSSWARDVQGKGCRVRLNGDEYELMP